MTLIFGGTFDPVHRGHTHLAKAVLSKYKPEKLLVIPAYQNPHKAEGTSASAEHRLEMVRIAMEPLGASVLDREVKAPRPSYTWDTIQALRKENYENLTLLMGDDVFNHFFDWYKAETLVKEVNLVVVTRSETEMAAPEIVLAQLGILDFERDESSGRIRHGKPSRWIDIFHFSPLPIASTQLRAEISAYWASGESLPPPQGIEAHVWNYIKENRLYAR